MRETDIINSKTKTVCNLCQKQIHPLKNCIHKLEDTVICGHPDSWKEAVTKADRRIL